MAARTRPASRPPPASRGATRPPSGSGRSRLNSDDLAALIRGGVNGSGPAWADLGSGAGAFTAVLADLLGPGAEIYSVDRDSSAVARQRQLFGETVTIRQGDFTKPLELPLLDGVLMANSLHFQRDKQAVLALVHRYLKPGGRLLVVEYDVDRGNHWVPYPFSFETWRPMAVAAGFSEPELLARHPSRWLEGLYSAVSTRQ